MAFMIDLRGKAALVTGGSRGIGREIAIELAAAGAAVAVNYRRSRREAESVVREITAAGGRAIPIKADVSSPADATALLRSARSAFGRLDILVNNAGIWEEASIERMTPRDLERTLAVNLKGVVYCCRAAVPALRASRTGRIINISSTAALLGEPLHSHYAASKGGLEALTKSLAVELGRWRITSNSVAPGWTVTDMTVRELRTAKGKKLLREIPLRKVATPPEVAAAVVFLASDLSSHITGVMIPVDGGYRIRR
jgi:3-oxoacyl-[acyl-carrier protein] reductase